MALNLTICLFCAKYKADDCILSLKMIKDSILNKELLLCI